MKKFIVLLCCAMLTVRLFAATMDSRVRNVPQELAEAVFEQPKEKLPVLVRTLISGVSGDAAKVKVLHDWICDNIAYDTDVFTVGVWKQDYETVLKKRRAICSGYTNLMNEMCRLAKVESIGIEGYSKGFGYRGYLEEECDHAWNAVKIGGRWQLIDVTWDAGTVEWTTFVKRYSTEWLNLTPEQFIYSHLPEKDEYQYLRQPRTKEQFVAEPYIPGIFFQYGLSLGKAAPGYRNEIEEDASYELKLAKSNILILSDLVDKDTGEFIRNATWAERTGNAVRATFAVPDMGKYQGRFLAKNRGEGKNPFFFSIAEFEQDLLPRVQGLLDEKKITQKEADFFEPSYFKVEENGRYYFAEDLFDRPRNVAVTKILTLLEKTQQYEEVLAFELAASGDYEGYGRGVLHFPSPYGAYEETANTHLISPNSGVLEGGAEQEFVIDTKDFSSLGVVIDGKLSVFAKNAKTGRCTFSLTVPSAGRLVICGTKNGKNYQWLWEYIVE